MNMAILVNGNPIKDSELSLIHVLQAILVLA